MERTTALFAQVRSAYEVLSDDQERAWYDAHEGDILRGGTGEGTTEDHYQGNMRVTTSEALMRTMGKFRGNVEFSDSPNGFYGFVRDTFEQLAREEEYAADYEDTSIPEYPTFGHKDDHYDDVVRNFYAAWNGFATAKSFAWLDRYRLSDAPDRRTRRLMEKENQKFRDDGRRDFNDAVRALIAFVRKRDPRYTPNQQSDEDKAKAQRDARQAQAARARAAQLAKLEQETQAVPSWTTARPADELEEESEEDIEEEHYECVACNKTFKSERQYEAHEKSKKHQKAIQSLKKQMQRDNAHFDLDDNVLGDQTPVSDHESQLGVDAAGSEVDNIADDGEASSSSSHASLNDTDEAKPPKLGSKEEKEDRDAHRLSSGAIDKDSKSNHATVSVSKDMDDSDDGEDDDEYASRSDIEARLAGFSIKANSGKSKANDETSSTDAKLPGTETPPGPTLGKAAQKRAKKAAKQAEVDQSESKHRCQGCDAAFGSKNQLFQHLDDHPKHAALKQEGKKKGKRK